MRAEEEPETVSRLRAGLTRARTSTAGGAYSTIPAPLSEFAASAAPEGAVVVRRPRFDDPAAEERGRAEIRAALQRELPPRFAWARWASRELAARVEGGASKVAGARRALADRSGLADRVVIIGAAGRGKTSLAVAHLADRIEAGVERARFIPARQLLADRHVGGVSWEALALSARLLVLDDLGAELTGAPAGGGLAAQRIEVVSRLLADRHDLDLGHVITTAHERPSIVALYGDGVARRVFDDATVIRCRA